MSEFSKLKHVHIVGACGTLMGSFAAFLKRSGIRVTGSDQNVYPPMSDVLAQAGVELFSGYQPENLTRTGSKPDLVVIGNVISASNVEARAAIDGGYQYTSLPEAMERFLLQKTRNLVVSGTHGKTTTSSLLAHVLKFCGEDPSYFIGGVSLDLVNSFHLRGELTENSAFVLEGDEYDTAFWDKVPKFNHYRPVDVILTSVEYDHADIYPDFASVMKAFEGLIERIQPKGKLIACTETESVKTLVKKAKVPVISYARASSFGADYWIQNFARCMNGNFRFDVFKRTSQTGAPGDATGMKTESLEIQLPGEYNALNALAVWIQCRELGIPLTKIAAGLKAFRGVKRRQEIRGEVGGVTVIDDFAHHPTAVRETVGALKKKYPDRRLIIAFEPRSATSRRKVFQKDYAEAFDAADEIFISQPFDQSKLASDDLFSSDQLVADICSRKKSAHFMKDVESGVVQLKNLVKTGDVVAILSNGGFGGIIEKLLTVLSPKT